MLLSPVLECVVAKKELHRYVIAVMVGLLVWGWLPVVVADGGGHLNMLRINGMQGSGILLMMAIYLIARLTGQRPVYSRRIRIFFLGAFFALMGLLAYVGTVGGYANPLVLLTTMCGFNAIRGVKLHQAIANVCIFLAPSMWSVYVLHECCLKKWQTQSFVTSPCRAFVWSLAMTMGCVGIDLARRLLFVQLKCFRVVR